ncbi:MAG: RNA-binding transcriptional accessory protein [Bacteroidia bacterium]|nr:RNA-binding transcriptional accessory protein [Bacteroidia bacterium]
MTETIVRIIQDRLSLPFQSVKNTVSLFSDGATIPFIARYRKEVTGSLDEIQISAIKKELQSLEDLIKRKKSILKSIEEQGQLSHDLKKKIENCWSSQHLEDLYLPFKKKVQTKAAIARKNGLEPLAKLIVSQSLNDLLFQSQKFVTKSVKNVDAAFEGARFIIAEWISENSKTRDSARQLFNRTAIIESTLVKSKKEAASKYEQYFDYSESLKRIPSHRLLAIFRGEKEGFLKVKLDVDKENLIHNLERFYIKRLGTDSADQIKLAIQDALKRLIIPSIENETKKSAKLKADKEAIEVFTKNLKELLLSPPLGSKSILALDPGFRTGCKLVVLDTNGNLIHDETIYPHPPQSKIFEAQSSIAFLVDKYNVEAIAIGNGTAGKETYKMVNNIKFDSTVDVFFVNESGASIYSASEIARKEFPHKDITVRGAVSIGRRLMDPLAELVKIDPKSIGVGQYQHDVNQVLLKEGLEETISSCVNTVGIDLNTASAELLKHISGLGLVLGSNIVKFRKENGSFKSRKALLKVPRMGKKAYEQSAGFLRIKNADNPLDNTAVHPEAYSVVEKIARDKKLSLAKLIVDKESQKNIKLQDYCTDKIGLPTLLDITKELEKPGLDPRGKASVVKFSNDINSIDDLYEGMILPGIVNNITKFGAFVDIGIKESGLVHISEITNKFINDVSEVLHLNQEVNVKVINIDAQRKRVGLSIKQAN